MGSSLAGAGGRGELPRKYAVRWQFVAGVIILTGNKDAKGGSLPFILSPGAMGE